jgi:NAD(P)-dependent dehydrogenase (short-subunit alcohol dehydrogenase family)
MSGVNDMTGRTALVTGASRGIGRAIAIRLAARGAAVIVHFGTDEDGAAATAHEIERTGGTALTVRAELGVEDDIDTLFAGVEAALAGRPLDILVNNAAAAPAGPLGVTTRAEFDHLTCSATVAASSRSPPWRPGWPTPPRPPSP